jgi:hypothetical protein
MLFTNLILLAVLTISGVLPQGVSLPDAPAGVTVRNVKYATFTAVSSTGSVAGTPGSTPNRLPQPTDGSAVRIERTELHTYSMELNNQGAKSIKALSWDFTFTDRATNAELLRHSFANVLQIDPAKHKTVKFTTQLSPPKTVSVRDLAQKSSPFLRSATLQCVLFTDGSTWEHSDAQGKACERLQRWLERRKTWHPELEDLPFNP